MTYERFSQLWNESGAGRSSTSHNALVDTMGDRAQRVLIAYGQGDTSYFDEARRKLNAIQREENLRSE